MKETQTLKKSVISANRAVGRWYELLGLGQTLMTLGHVSARVPGKESFLVKGRRPKEDLLVRVGVRSIVEVDFDGEKIGGRPEVSLPNETKLHSWIYRSRPDVGAVCHAHPHYSVLASVLGIELKPMCNEGINLFPVPTYPDNALISDDEQGKGMVEAMGRSNACLLRGHGTVNVADTAERAVLDTFRLEEQARLNVFGLMAAGASYPSIPDEQARRYVDLLEKVRVRYMKTAHGRPDDRMTANLWSYVASDL